jgi:hypothetical protein
VKVWLQLAKACYFQRLLVHREHTGGPAGVPAAAVMAWLVFAMIRLLKGDA